MSPEPKDAKRLSVSVRIMGKEFNVECPPEEHEALVRSAEMVNERMNNIRKRGKALGSERIAVMVALNLAHDLLALKGVEGVAPGADPVVVERVRQLKLDIDSTLSAE